MEKEKIEEKRKDGWIEAHFLFEVMAVDEDTTKKALESHINKLSKEAFLYDVKYQNTTKIDNPAPNIKEAHSQIADARLFMKDIFALTRIVLLYGPASVEIIGPKEKKIALEEMQNVSNMLSGLVHEFASKGAGGILISPASG